MGKTAKTGMQFESRYRFSESGTTTAILEQSGKLFIKQGGLEVYEKWQDYVKEVLGDKPETGGEDAIIAQLSIGLGSGIETIENEAAVKVTRPEKNETNEGENTMATATKKAVAVAKAVAKNGAKAPKVSQPCLCGCGTMTGGFFAPGHDAKVHSICKKVQKGEAKQNQIAAPALKYAKEKGWL